MAAELKRRRFTFPEYYALIPGFEFAVDDDLG